MNGFSASDPNAIVGRRGESRLRVRLEATVITLDGSCRAILTDLSCQGARFEHPHFAFRTGAEAVVQWGQREAFGIIVWSAGGKAGIRFYEPVSHGVVAETRRIDEAARLPAERDRLRQSARSFVQGQRD